MAPVAEALSTDSHQSKETIIVLSAQYYTPMVNLACNNVKILLL